MKRTRPLAVLLILPRGVRVVSSFKKNNRIWLVFKPHWLFPNIKPLFGSCYEKRSRVMMAIKLGRPLHKGEIVHHIDENKLNDDYNNLEVTTQDAHNKHHKCGTKHRLESRQQIGASVHRANIEGRVPRAVIYERDKLGRIIKSGRIKS
jgi:predicted molibdopterin-dependent oxidoreductase YjgC